MKYSMIAVCSECGHLHGPIDRGGARHIRDLCQGCGMDPGTWMNWGRDGTGRWYEERRMWQPASVWWKPWTWFTGGWITPTEGGRVRVHYNADTDGGAHAVPHNRTPTEEPGDEVECPHCGQHFDGTDEAKNRFHTGACIGEDDDYWPEPEGDEG